jgi:5-methylcytosine-specific restriction endonuclease McrA
VAPTLVLNATFEPIAVVPTRRAIILVLTDKAEVVEAGDDEWRSATTAVPVPVVVRLRRFVKIPYRTRVPLTRQNLLVRDNHRCAYCPARATTIDHVIPRSKGGPHRWENVVAACERCNGKKDDRTLAQLGWRLSFTPKAPHGQAWLIVGIAERVPEWEPYLNRSPALAGT